ncbi:MAG: LptF/LptG family permease [Gemmatimonadota bacterium]|jgi:lipopolysaccharide export system permease protein|nr:LptF/LptG family permease [Gemmatimonadota bacterium]
MKLLDRYVAGQFLATFIGLVLGLPLLFVVTDVTDNLDRYLDRGLGTGEVALAYLYQLPLFVQYAFPIAALVATVFTIGGMTAHLEISAAKAAGISFYRLLAPILVLAVLLTGVALALGEVVPVTNRLRAETLRESPTRHTGMRSDFVFQTEDGKFLSVRRLDPAEGTMTEVVLEQPPAADRSSMHGTASRATWTQGAGWKLEEGYIRYLTEEGAERTFGFASLQRPAFRETPEDLLAEPLEAEEMRYTEISRFISAIERSGGDARPLRTERAQKIALPLAVLVIVLFGAPLATSTERGGAAYGVGISLAITLVYLMLFRVGKAAGSSGWMDPLLAAWGPNLLFFLGAVVLLARVRT